ncbi:Metallo-dependent phosphatase-like protein [Penicillium pulvis]|uniref:Metallo-dependent phosphatase-like protein n=1 Tax=Penicillium pulvis TaxID=1562058 RepID=UPI0025496D99|nr:Metallo-dependent phosphatase-like protein [Penicillium pulvis]KAJ5813604.1 Metallo-dependent phosphatase-like protein [Penicillium pulvis]
MKATTASILLALSAAANASPAVDRRTVDERFPYKGPAVPIGDWVDNTINGNGKGFTRLVEAPAVKPAHKNPTNNVNVISLAYIPDGMLIHYQTPFGLGRAPTVKWGTNPHHLTNIARGYSHSYDRTPSCSQIKAVTQCSEYFHEVSLPHLESGKTYYYQIPAANGTTESEVLSFTTARKAGDPTEFSVAVLNDMGYTNAQGTHKYLTEAASEAAFAWHGGDISYADDWSSGIMACESDWPVCYNGSSSELPGGITDEYKKPLPAGEIPNQGGPQGGDMSVIYESNWDLWQQWMGSVTKKIPYMVLPGNHEASCGEFDGPGNVLTAYLDENQPNSTWPTDNLTYYSCPPSQRNFTAYQHRFRMPGKESGGVSNFWYSFDYGLAHFVSMDGETDYADSPEWSFAEDVSGDETLPTESETFITDSGPFGAVSDVDDTKSYEQYKWLKADLESVDRTKTPWIVIMSHRPMYSSAYSSYMKKIRAAFEALFLEHGVDLYLSGHIHWYERLFPLGNGTIDTASVINNHTYRMNPGKSMTHVVNGMAGNIESHSEFSTGEGLTNITAVLNTKEYGFSKLTVANSTAMKWEYIKGNDGSVGDSLWMLKPTASNAQVPGKGQGAGKKPTPAGKKPRFVNY